MIRHPREPLWPVQGAPRTGGCRGHLAACRASGPAVDRGDRKMSRDASISMARSAKFLDITAGIVRTARPRQWVKNAFVLAPLLFSGQITHGPSVFRAALATLAFTLASVGMYFWNDVADCARDREHPVKRLRPIAAGQISVSVAVSVAISAAMLGLALAAYLNIATFAALAAYVVLQLVYSWRLKHKAVVDVMCIALGFVLRVSVGGMAIAVVPSSWLLVCTLFLATFLGFAKRRGEVVRLANGPEPEAASRPVLIVYHDQLLLILLSITCSLTMVSYALYTVERQPPSVLLLGTIPVVAYALFRYLLLVLRLDESSSGESPEDLMLGDAGLITAGLLWAAMCVVAVLISSPLPVK